jgi:alpha-ketoglutarate-dependent 2,4-dichlorophenoxyacetate dioxygenase
MEDLRNQAESQLEVGALHPRFAAEMLGADLRAPPSPALVRAVEAAMDAFAVLVIRDQFISDEEHIRFSRAFGPLELPPKMGTGFRQRLRRELYDASNLDANGELLPADSTKRRYNRGNELFHSDSSFNSLPTKWSLLLAHVLPARGGNTDLIDTRAVYDDLDAATRARIEDLTAEHCLWHSRGRAGFSNVSEEMRRLFPPARHKLVRVMPNGRRALYIGAHASHIVELPRSEGEALLQELYHRAAQPQYIYSHVWRPGDLLIWDNRCTLHRAGGGYDDLRQVRDLRRTTVNECGPELASTDLLT